LIHAPTRFASSSSTRRGFTLIEVVVAMSILVVVVLALLSSYSFFYGSINALRLQSIGQNLAQLQLEDIRNTGMVGFEKLLGTEWVNPSAAPSFSAWPARLPDDYTDPNYPPAELFNISDISGSSVWYWYSYGRATPSEPIAGPSNLPYGWYDASGNPISPSPQTVGPLPSAGVLASVRYNPSGVPIEYDSGIRDPDFIIADLSSVPSTLLLPASISVSPTPSSSPTTYDLHVERWTFPYYKKRITVTDETPGVIDIKEKLYSVSVTVYWPANGVQKSYTVKQEVAFEGQASN